MANGDPGARVPAMPGPIPGPGRFRATVGWVVGVMVTGTIAVGGVGALVDTVRLAMGGVPLRNVVAGALCPLAIATLLSVLLGPPVAGIGAGISWLWRGRFPRKLAALSLVLGIGLLLGVGITMARHHQDPTLRSILVGTMAVGFSVVFLSALPSTPRILRLLTIAIIVVSFLADAWMPRWYYREVHDLLATLTFSGVLAIAASTQGWRRGRRLHWPFAVACVASLAFVHWVDGGAPGWRAQSDRFGLYGPTFARAGRALLDWDRDGYSSVFWGGDCDDRDASRNPLAADGPGRGDPNCNGIDPPKVASEAQRGLFPAVGDPNLSPGRINLVILATVDALRADSLRPDRMPRLSAAAATGIQFSRAYSSGTRTSVTLPLLQSGGLPGVPLGRRLAAANIVTSMVVADAGMEGVESLAPGFERVVAPHRGRWNGAETTRRALARVEEIGSRPHYLWVHYYDAHSPYPAAETLPVPPGLHSSYARYATGVRSADSALGALFDGLTQRGRMDRALIIVGADHGEAFGEHGMLFHAASAFEPVVRIPLVLMAPGLVPQRYPHLVGHGDIFPTILGAFGSATAGDELHGRSWLRLRAEPTAPLHRFIFIRSAHAASGGDVMSPLLAIVDGRYKLVKTLEDSLQQLFDLDVDPDERTDLLPRLPGVARRLERELETYRDIIGYPTEADLADLKTFAVRRLDAEGHVY